MLRRSVGAKQPTGKLLLRRWFATGSRARVSSPCNIRAQEHPPQQQLPADCWASNPGLSLL